MISEVYFCPQCGSSSLKLPELTGGIAVCLGCGWSGATSELIVTAFQHEEGTDTQVIERFMGELRTAVSKELAIDLGRILVKWGFLNNGPSGINPKELSKYLTGISRSILTSVLTTRQEIERDRLNAGPTH